MKLEIIDQEQFNKRPLLPKDIMEQWLTALRSGEYLQIRDYLCFKGRYCCLGVLTTIQDRPKEVSDDYTKFDNSYYCLQYNNPLFEVLNTSGMFVGFAIDNHGNLANLNDKNYSFEQIAEVIELYF